MKNKALTWNKGIKITNYPLVVCGHWCGSSDTNIGWVVVVRRCCQLAFFNARFCKFGIFENDSALKILKFIYCLVFFCKNSYLLFGIRNFEKLFNKIINMALFIQEFGTLL